jgi:sugar phosphate isomerase/epimerase
LDGIEWGGDIHIPIGNLNLAEEIRKLMANACLETISYCSYYRLGENDSLAFKTVLQTAQVLGAAMIRIWAGSSGSALTTPEKRKDIIADAIRVADMAAESHTALSLEYHDKTLTDTAESAQKLMNEINHNNLHLYWQTTNGAPFNENVNNLKLLLPWITNIHVFNWQSYQNRFLLESGFSDWLEYLKILQSGNHNRFASLEFVKNDEPENFLKDAATLKRLIRQSANL